MSAMLIALALAAPSVRAADETPNPWKFEFHGFVTASMYYQNEVFVNAQGQGLLLAAPTPSNRAPCDPTGGFRCAGPAPQAATGGGGSAISQGSDISGDVRNSRFSFSMAGPKVFDGAAQPRAYLEFDFFGPNGGGTYATEQQIPRLRVGYAELKFGNSNLQVGQQNQLVVPQIPASISHIANPMTYGAGTIGWRTPGLRFTHLVPIDDMKLELAVEVVKNKWNNEIQNQGTGVPQGPAVIGFGEAGLPMFQARAKLDGKAGDLTYMAYLVGVYHSAHVTGFGDSYTQPTWTTKKDITGYVAELGGKFTYQPVFLAFNVYTGKTTGNMLGSMVYFGDIKDMGYWANLGVNFTKEIQLSAVYGANTPDKADVRRVAGNTARLASNVMGGMLKYQDGGYALGVEGYQVTTTYSSTATTTVDSAAVQVIATAAYLF
jgi:hypothetical protein